MSQQTRQKVSVKIVSVTNKAAAQLNLDGGCLLSI